MYVHHPSDEFGRRMLYVNTDNWFTAVEALGRVAGLTKCCTPISMITVRCTDLVHSQHEYKSYNHGRVNTENSNFVLRLMSLRGTIAWPQVLR